MDQITIEQIKQEVIKSLNENEINPKQEETQQQYDNNKLDEYFFDNQEVEYKVKNIRKLFDEYFEYSHVVDKPVYYPAPFNLYMAKSSDPQFFISGLQFKLGNHNHPKNVQLRNEDFRYYMVRCEGVKLCIKCKNAVGQREKSCSKCSGKTFNQISTDCPAKFYIFQGYDEQYLLSLSKHTHYECPPPIKVSSQTEQKLFFIKY